MKSVERFKDTIERQYGTIFCYGPNGEYFEARTIREAAEFSGIHRNTINYAYQHDTRPKGWRFERNWK